MLKVSDIAEAIEKFAPVRLQESYDNTGLQIGNPQMRVGGVLLCLDVTEDIIEEALKRECNMIVSHHPLLFSGLKHITGATPTERIAAKALNHDIAIYAAHTNLDSAPGGVSHMLAQALGLTSLKVLEPIAGKEEAGLGVTGEIKPTPKLEFLRKVKEALGIEHLRYSAQSPQIVIRKVAICGGAGASMIKSAAQAGADCLLTGDLKYHDYTTWAHRLLLADIGHYESEQCAKQLLYNIIRHELPECAVLFAESETNPVTQL